MADTLDVLTLTEAKEVIGVTSNDRDALVAAWVTAVSRFLDGLCGPVVQRAVTAELHDGGDPTIWLLETPVASVTSLTEYSGTTATTLTQETPGVLPAAGFLLYPLSGKVMRRSGGSDSRFASGRRNITVTYVAGRFTATGTVDEEFKRAAGEILDHNWRVAGLGSDTLGPPEVPRGFALPSRTEERLSGGGEMRSSVPSGVA